MAEQSAEKQAQGSFLSFKRLAPLAILVAGIVAFYGFGLNEYVSFDTLRDNRETLLSLVEEHTVLTALGYMAVYVAVVAFSLPGGALMTITGGFILGTVWGTLCVVFAATIGATILFLIAKTALGDPLRERTGPWMRKMEAGFGENALSYLLVLRLIPLFPFFVVNLVPAFLGVPLGVYVLGTLIGIIPGTFVYVSVGAGLGSIFDSGGGFTLEGILTPQIITALVGLAILALLPVIYKKIRTGKQTEAGS